MSRAIGWFVCLVLLGGVVVGGEDAHAGPPPNLTVGQATAASTKWIRGLAARLDEPARGAVGACWRVNRFRVRCSGIVLYQDSGTVCRVPVTVRNTRTDSDGYYYRRVTGGRPTCAGASSSSPSRGRTYHATGSGHWIREVADWGRLVTLEDGSLWEVAPLDRLDASLWLVVDDIVVTETGSYGFPYRLTNTDRDETVEARYLG